MSHLGIRPTLVVWAAILAAACQFNSTRDTQVAPTQLVLATLEVPTRTAMVGLETVRPNTAHTPSPALATTTAADTEHDCPVESSELSAQGVLVLVSSENHELRGMDLASQTHKEWVLPEGTGPLYDSYWTTVDHSGVVFFSNYGPGLHLGVASVSDDQIRLIKWDDEQLGTAIYGWTDDGTGLLVHAPISAVLPEVRSDITLLFSLTDGQVSTLEASWDYSTGSLWFPWRSGYTALYSPKMLQVLYLDVETPDGNNRFVLYDLVNKEVVWVGLTKHLQDPVWTPTGNRFIYVANSSDVSESQTSELAIVDDRGQEERLYPSLSSNEDVTAVGFSPNGRYAWYIGATAQPDQSQIWRLRLWDTSSHQWLNCSWDTAYSPMWSSTGDQLVVRVESDPFIAGSHILIDLPQGRFLSLETDSSLAVAWLVPER